MSNCYDSYSLKARMVKSGSMVVVNHSEWSLKGNNRDVTNHQQSTWACPYGESTTHPKTMHSLGVLLMQNSRMHPYAFHISTSWIPTNNRWSYTGASKHARKLTFRGGSKLPTFKLLWLGMMDTAPRGSSGPWSSLRFIFC